MKIERNIVDQDKSSESDPHEIANAKDVESTDLDYICDALTAEFSTIAGKTVAITGAAGFLGFYLASALARCNDRSDEQVSIKVVLIDAFMRGRPDWIDQLGARAEFTILHSNVIDAPSVQLREAHFIIHAASIASPIFYREHPIETMDANVIGLRNILDLALDRQQSGDPLQGLLYFSTSEIYGDPDPDNIPTKETFRGSVSCTGPRACYDESKRYGETLCVNFSRQHAIQVTIARPFNNYGPGLKITDKRAPPDFANDVLNDRDIVLLSDGSPTRTFCYIADAVVGYYKVLFNGVSGESYNIGNSAPEVSIKDFARMNVDAAKDLFDYQGDVKFVRSEDADYLTDNPQRRCPDINKAVEQLGFNPVVSLENGIRRSLIWYNENRSGGNN